MIHVIIPNNSTVILQRIPLLRTKDIPSTFSFVSTNGFFSTFVLGLLIGDDFWLLVDKRFREGLGRVDTGGDMDDFSSIKYM